MAQATDDRVHNFSAGPAALPLRALEEAQRDLLVLPGAGASVMEISHRSKTFLAVLEDAKANIKNLMKLPDNYRVLFIQGGASMQFSMLAMNFLQNSPEAADYILTGAWGNKAIKEAQKVGKTNVAWSGKSENHIRVPAQSELSLNPKAPYVHFTSNETIEGVEFREEPETGNVPLICDASSNFLSKPVAVEKYGLIYAGAQKNVGPSGVAIAILREDLLDRVPEGLPSLLDYKILAENDSLYNTPPTFAIYMIMLVTKWLREAIGGLDKMHEINQAKAKALYDVIDANPGFYTGHARKEDRSLMNVTFRLPSEDLEKTFIDEATKAGLHGLKGHRSVGGCRASIYNAMSMEGVDALRDFMIAFKHKQGA